MDFNIAASIASILGLFVGIAGLFISYWAWNRAKAAEQAAKEAREAVHLGSAAEDLRSLTAKAIELLACVQENHMEAACVCGRDLVSGINIARQRWQSQFGQGTSGERLRTTGLKVEKNLSSSQQSKPYPHERGIGPPVEFLP